MRFPAGGMAAVLFSSLVGALAAQSIPASQPPVWSTPLNVEAFEKLENHRLDAASQSIARITAVRGPRTIENTLAPYDEALRQLNTASYLSSLMQQVHPDSAFRDRATAMTTKVGAAITALSLDRAVYDALSALDVSRADAPHPVLR
jgi:thimet oligopeptidase